MTQYMFDNQSVVDTRSRILGKTHFTLFNKIINSHLVFCRNYLYGPINF